MRGSGGPYGRTELDLLNAGRDGPHVGVDEIVRVYRGDLAGVTDWFVPKPMPEGWAARLEQAFAGAEDLVVAFGYPHDASDFFVVHDVAMRTIVECPVPEDRVVLADSGDATTCSDQRAPTVREITEPLPGGEVVYVDARPTPYQLRVVDHDPTWAWRYRELEEVIRGALGERVLDIQHVGSTAVPGLPAKPVIDIDLTVADPADEASYVPALQALGFVHWLTEPDWHQHRLLKLLDEPQVHLHVYGEGCPEVVRTRMFRDWLVEHPEDRERYAAAKRQALAELEASGADPEALDHGMRYNRIKEPVVHDIQERMFRAAGLID